MSTNPPDDLDPAAFIKRIRALSQKHDQEDALRLSSIESDIEKSRSERAARRAERARSLSPEKFDALSSPPSAASRALESLSKPAMDALSPPSMASRSLESLSKPAMEAPSPSRSRADAIEDSFSKLTGAGAAESPRSASPAKSASALGRSGTLSWQQRPALSGGSRPLSGVATTRASEEASGPTRNQIARSLSARDPSWFKQTADRGLVSPAYRKNQEAAASDAEPARRFGLPGMSSARQTSPSLQGAMAPPAAPRKNSDAEPARKFGLSGTPSAGPTSPTASIPGAMNPPPDSLRSNSPSRVSSFRESSTAWSNRFSTATSNTTYSNADQQSTSKAIADPPKLSPASTQDTPAAMRPASPTKGLGGFVGSAMMKRSDSVSKRWSAHAAQGLNRHNSVAGARGGATTSVSMPRLDQAGALSREAAFEANSRPSSSHSIQTITHGGDERTSDGIAKPALPLHVRSKSIASLASQYDDAVEPSPPPNPSKRWSPTKSSWLENAINKPDSQKAGLQSQKPAWMAELNKNKQHKADQSVSDPPPMPEKPSGERKAQSAAFTTSRNDEPNATTAIKPSTAPTESKAPEAAAINRAASPIITSSPFPQRATSPPPPETGPNPSSPPKIATQTSDSRAPPLSSRASRDMMDASSQQEAEFKNVFGKLRKAETKNFKAPDTSRDNIVSGKNALNVTGGVPPRVRRDELKEMLVGRKAEMAAKKERDAAEGKPASPPVPERMEVLPEALAARRRMGERPPSGEKVGASPVREREGLERTPSWLRDSGLRDAGLSGLKDAGLKDAILRDAGLRDSGLRDTGLSGLKDAGLRDSGPKDAGLRDAGLRDSGPRDAGLSGLRDTGLSGLRDTGLNAGLRDAGLRDAGLRDSGLKDTGLSGLRDPGLSGSRDTGLNAGLKDDGLRDPGPRGSGFGGANVGISSPFTTSSQSPAPAAGLRVGVSSKLAERFNPGLANMLARGPPSATPTRTGSSDNVPSTPTKSDASEPKPGAPLEHMTKGRARGPKRRAPIAKKAEIVASEESVKEEIKEEDKTDAAPAPVSPAKDHVLVGNKSNPPSPSKNRALGNFDFGFDAQGDSMPWTGPRSPMRSTVHQPIEPDVGAEETIGRAVSPEAERIESPRPPLEEEKKKPYSSLARSGGMAAFANQIANKAAGGTAPATLAKSMVDDIAPAASPVSSSATRANSFQQEPKPPRIPSTAKVDSRPSSPEKPVNGKVSVKNAAAAGVWGQQGSSSPATAKLGSRPSSPVKRPISPVKRPISPVKLPIKADEDDAMRDAGLTPAFESPKRNRVGLGLQLDYKNEEAPSTAESTAPWQPRAQLPMSPPASAGIDPKAAPARLPHPAMPSPADMKSLTATPSIDSPGPKRSRPVSITIKPLPEPPAPQTSEATTLFGDFFITSPRMPEFLDIDTAALLEANPLDTTKSRTVKKSIHEITSEGKLIILPPSEEYTVYEACMYVVVHTFETNGKKATEVCLWTGSAVSSSAVEDAQLFAKKIVKENGAKSLTIVPQGKEPPSFFQALGGIVITRRGARPPQGSRNSQQGQTFMLCGRKHMWHIAFDEVDFSLRAFCSGFAFIVFANNILHLWKGVGCTAEEVGCARLIAMDVGVSPDVVEVAEGKEPQSFIDLFPKPEKGPMKIFPSADFWERRKGQESRYRTRLFRVEDGGLTANGKARNSTVVPSSASLGGFQVSSLWPPFLGRRPSWSASAAAASPPPPSLSTSRAESPLSPSAISDRSQSPPQTPTKASAPSDAGDKIKVSEVVPYSQDDMVGVAAGSGVFMLDAFFELYIILTPNARQHPSAFTTALLFAQDYGILAASLEDRPFVPISTVVLEGAPKDMKACFRKWDDGKWATGATTIAGNGSATNGAAGVGRGKSMRVVGLDAAIAATMNAGG